jgi:hypothetical protein
MVRVGGLVLIVAMSLSGQEKAAGPTLVSVAQIKAQPARYDGKVVESSGTLHSGHIGVFLSQRDSGELLRLEFVKADPRGVRIIRDAMLSRLLQASSEIELPEQPKRKYEIRLLGLVHVLKGSDGKPAKKYNLYLEAPVQLIPVRVLAITEHQVTESKQ